jgi:hypothetical protein
MANAPATVTNPQADDAAAKAHNALWYAFQGIGRCYLIQRGTAAAGDADISGVHGYNTIEQALSNANLVNATSQPTITQWDTWASLPFGGGSAGVIETVNVTWSTNKQGKKVATSSTPQNPTTASAGQLTGLAAIGDFFNKLENSNTWLRVGEVILGIALISVGVARLTHTVSFVEKAASKVPLIV